MKVRIINFLVGCLLVFVLALLIGIIYKLEHPQPAWQHIDQHNELEQLKKGSSR